MNKSDFCIFLSLCCLAFSGCGRDLPEVGLVKGSVMLDGQPLAGVVVTFMPDEGRPATGITNDLGMYELSYNLDTKGCMVGNNTVSIESSDAEASAVEREGDGFVQTAENIQKNIIPTRYNLETQLTADVKPGDNTFDFDLKTTE